jgi:uncharacterized damage-inducible protein DinB
MTFLELLRSEFDHEMESTRKVLACVPGDKLGWKPHEKSMLLGRLAGHVAELPGRAVEISTSDIWVRTPGFVPFSATSQEELLNRFASTSTAGRKALEGLIEDRLSTTWTIKFGDKVVLQLPRALALRTVMMNHLIHHRAQLGVYLRLLDIPIPGVYGPSGDEKL